MNVEVNAINIPGQGIVGGKVQNIFGKTFFSETSLAHVFAPLTRWELAQSKIFGLSPIVKYIVTCHAIENHLILISYS